MQTTSFFCSPMLLPCMPTSNYTPWLFLYIYIYIFCSSFLPHVSNLVKECMCVCHLPFCSFLSYVSN
jgi:hypothetical protein